MLNSLLFGPFAVFQGISIAASLRFLVRSLRRPKAKSKPPISVLKPVRGVDPNTFPAFVSQAAQDYPNFEILFGVRNPNDPVVAEIEKLQRQFPNVDIRLIRTSTDALNAKTGTLMELAKHASHPIWVVNDGDIKVGPDYLSRLAAELDSQPHVGLVTCPYRAWAHSAATQWESLGIAIDFVPGVFVADMLGVRDYGLGATLAFRRDDFLATGGFEAISTYIADDYQIGNRLAKAGKPTHLSGYVVETALGEDTWSGVWNHQLRWARTIRYSKPGAYIGLPIAYAGVWAIAAYLGGAHIMAAALVALRFISALLSSLVLRNWRAAAYFPLAPLWDLYEFAVWLASYMNNEVRWRDRVLRLARDGRIIR